MANWGSIFNTVGNVAQTGAAVYGGLADAGVFGSNNGGTSSSSTKDPWGVAQPYMTDALRQGQDLYRSGQGSEYYPGQGFTQMGADTSAGLDMARQRSIDGSPTMDAANQSAQQMMGSGPNPWSDAAMDKGRRNIIEGTKSFFSKNGRYGEDMANAGSQALGDYEAQFQANAYNTNQNNRLQAMNLAPGLANADYNDAQARMGVGQGIEGYQTAERQADQKAWDFNQQNPYDRLNQYSNLAGTMGGMGGTYSGTGSTTPSTSQQIGNVAGAFGNISDVWGGNNNTYEPYPGYKG